MNPYKSLKNFIQTAILTIALAGVGTSLEGCITTHTQPTIGTQSKYSTNNDKNYFTRYATEEEGELQLSNLAKTKMTENSVLYVKNRNLWIDLGGTPTTEDYLEELDPARRVGSIGLNVESIIIQYTVKRFRLEGEEVIFYHQHPDMEFTKNLQNGVIKGVSVITNFPSSIDYFCTPKIEKLLQECGVYPLPSRIVGSMYTTEYQQTSRKSIKEIQEIMDTTFKIALSETEPERSIFETIDVYMKELRKENIYLRIIRAHKEETINE